MVETHRGRNTQKDSVVRSSRRVVVKAERFHVMCRVSRGQDSTFYPTLLCFQREPLGCVSVLVQNSVLCLWIFEFWEKSGRMCADVLKYCAFGAHFALLRNKTTVTNQYFILIQKISQNKPGKTKYTLCKFLLNLRSVRRKIFFLSVVQCNYNHTCQYKVGLYE